MYQILAWCWNHYELYDCWINFNNIWEWAKMNRIIGKPSGQYECFHLILWFIEQSFILFHFVNVIDSDSKRTSKHQSKHCRSTNPMFLWFIHLYFTKSKVVVLTFTFIYCYCVAKSTCTIWLFCYKTVVFTSSLKWTII